MPTAAPLNNLPPLRTSPYVTVPEFRAMPTYLDSDDLVVTGNTIAAAQDSELRNELIRASAWCDDYVNQPLGGHLWTQQLRLAPNRFLEFRFHAEHQPIRQLQSFSYGSSTAGQFVLSDMSQVSYPGGSQVIVPLAGGSYSFSGPLQFGGMGAPGLEQQVQVSYTAGFACTEFAANAAQGATSVQLVDTTAIHPGDLLRIWDPSKEEAVTVASVVGTTVTFTTALTQGHSTGAGISAMPPDVKRAVAIVTAAYIARPGTGEDPFADAPVSRSGRKVDPRKRGSGMLERVEKLLKSYRQVIA
jgi:hypothetical protein